MARSRETGIEDRILDAAFKIFGERGFRAAAVRDIAAEAGISSGSIYTYFPDKEDLFKAAVVRAWGKFIRELEGIAAEGLGREELTSALYGRGFAAFGAASPLMKAMFVEAAKFDLVEPYLDRACAALDRIVEPEAAGAGTEPSGLGDEARVRRHAATRTLVLGILASIALLPEAGPQAGIDALKETSAALLQREPFMAAGGST